jgi:RND family efflux transporter MFP subunit
MSRLKLLSVLLAFSAMCSSCGSSGESSKVESKAQSGAESKAQGAAAPPVQVVKVKSQRLSMKVRLPGELTPYEIVAIYPKVTGFVEWIGVDRGSHVHNGQLIMRLIAPELVAQRSEAQAKVQNAQAQRVEAEAKLAADQSTYQRLNAAAATPGVVAGNDLEIAQHAAEADRARVRAALDNVNAAKESLRSVAEMEAYLQIRAPFDGIVTERNVHPGALVGPTGGAGVVVDMVHIETPSRLRLVVPVPEAYVADIPEGTKVEFTVPAYPTQVFSAPIARIARSVEVKTRTMPVELDVSNSSGRLSAGMFSEVLWPVRRPGPTLFVPATAVARTTEHVFVVGIREGKAEWVEVKTGATPGNLVEIFGDLKAGDEVALRGTDELRPGAQVKTREASSAQK